MLLCTILQKLELHENSFPRVRHKDIQLILNELSSSEINSNQLYSTQHEDNYQEESILETMERGTLLCRAVTNTDLNTVRELLRCAADANLTDAYGRTALHTAVQRGHIGLIKMLLEHGADMHKQDPHGWTPKAITQEHGKEEIGELLSNYENRKRLFGDDQMQTVNSRRNSLSQSNWEWNTPFRYPKHADSESHSVDSKAKKLYNRRVAIHIHPGKSKQPSEQFGKLINLPGSIQELLRIGGQKFVGCNPTKVVNQENAEVDDLSVVRDGDHLFLLDE
ncbi:uncharacterized protein A4U43_C01F25180 [Asparagus officinalis]|uniref:KHA domain-containing protein n=1 Tax=Asparagus officinalis TaxID=4686 RepID=A0A5P1FW54_ASPOF|nr:uncharacterized protein A4U43_C01F25180 [Asparagus officinalis]